MTPLRAFALSLVLLPLAAGAQTSATLHRDLSRGVTLAPTGAALADEATASSVNPSGLGEVGALQLFYAHERSVARDQVLDGVYLADGFFGSLGAGFSLEWIRGGSGENRRRTSYALSFGSSSLSIGAALRVFSSNQLAELNGLTSFDLSLLSRPYRALSLGLVLRNVDAPSRGAVFLPRELDVGLGLRPFGERLTLAVDFLFGDAGPRAGRLSYALLGEVFRGVSLSVGASHGLNPGAPLLLQLGAKVDLPHFGVGYAVGSAPGGLDHTLFARLSSERYRGLSPGGGVVALVDLDDLLASRTSPALSLLGVGESDPYLRLTRFLDGAIRDQELAGVVIKVSQLPIGFGKAEELRRAIARLKAANKTVIAMVLSASDAEYHAISGADRIIAVPQAMLLLDGLFAAPTFFGQAMEKLGVSWDVAKVGAYKNAPDAFTRSEMTSEQREVINAYLDTDLQAYEAAVSQGRKLPSDKVRAALAEGLKSPRRAVELGLVDEVLSPAGLEDKLKTLLPNARFEASYRPRALRDDRWAARRSIAVVPVIGNISGGKSREDPLGVNEVAGAETVIRALDHAAEDPSVAAIVVRVDSGGGDGLASDLIYRAVLEAKKKKPVVASMGDVAASGGYYAAMGADEILANPTTLTGSIGVFFLKPALKGLAEKLGVHQESIRRGELSGVTQLYEPWSPAEKTAVERWVAAFYDDFIGEVAKSRKLSKEEVDRLARGRVWSGADAKSRGLVDRLGGLLEAIDAARARARIPASEEIDLALLGDARGLLATAAGEEGVLTRALGSVRPGPALPPAAAALARELGLDHLAESPYGLRAQMEFSLTVR